MTTTTICFVVHHVEQTDLDALFSSYPASAERDSQVLLVGTPRRRPWWHRLPRLGSTIVASVDDAVQRAAGDSVWFVDGRATVHREAWARCLRRLEEDPDVVHVRSSLRSLDGEVRSGRGLLATDLAVGAPVFAVVRRQALGADRMDATWPTLVSAEAGRIQRSHPVAVPVARRPGPLATTATLAARGGDLIVTPGGGPIAPPGGDPRPTVGWIGFHGKQNLGDEAVLVAAGRLLDPVVVVPGGEGTHGTVLGGGTLLNTKRFYQRIADEIDAPGLPRLVLGTGVVSPALRGFTEDVEQWRPFLEAGPVGVRGPDSAASLRAWGWQGPIEVVGDPALVLTASQGPRGAVRAADRGRVVLAPVGTSAVGQVEEQDAHRQHELLFAGSRRWIAEGRAVTVLLAHPGDESVGRRLLDSGVAVSIVSGWEDLEATLRLLADADLVVGTRLHAIVLAAAVGTPFVGLAYRPKLLDFAASVGVRDLVRPIDAWDAEALALAVTRAGSAASEERVASEVETLRRRLRTTADRFLEQVRALETDRSG